MGHRGAAPELECSVLAIPLHGRRDKDWFRGSCPSPTTTHHFTGGVCPRVSIRIADGSRSRNSFSEQKREAHGTKNRHGSCLAADLATRWQACHTSPLSRHRGVHMAEASSEGLPHSL